MKLIFIIPLLIMNVSCKAQKTQHWLANKTFIANVGSICEEVVGNSDCAGQQIYLVLEFKKEEVSILEKYVSTCGEESNTAIGNFKWKLLNTENVIIASVPEEIKYSFLNNLELKFSNGVLIGKRKNDANKHINDYIFKEITN